MRDTVQKRKNFDATGGRNILHDFFWLFVEIERLNGSVAPSNYKRLFDGKVGMTIGVRTTHLSTKVKIVRHGLSSMIFTVQTQVQGKTES